MLNALRRAKPHLNLALLSLDIGRERAYLAQALAGRFALTDDDAGRIRDALARYGLRVAEEEDREEEAH